MKVGDTHAPSLGPLESARLAELFRETAGLAFGDDARFAIERKLRERVVTLGLASFGDYAALLRRDTPEGRRELEEALDLVTTHETYFFREDYQLAAFHRQVLPSLCDLAASRRRLSIWSAGCATGEEAYSIAIILSEVPELAGWETRIMGTDLSKRCIAVARRGVYGKASFRMAPELADTPGFEAHPDGARVRAHVQKLCTFAQLNLLDEVKASVVGRVDAIFCRNLLIYLVPEARKAVLSLLHDRLVPGGYLMLGHSESLLSEPTPFEPVQLADALVYRRPTTDSEMKKRAR